MMVPAGVGAATTVRTQRKKPAARTKHVPEFPTLDVERGFLAPGVTLLAGVDEVGRGALAGPVSVGIAVVDLADHGLLAGVRDSKLLKPEERERLEPLVRDWALCSAVGHASSAEIDSLGIIGALRLAGTRAWFEILAAGVHPDMVLLDGSHNWLSPQTQGSLFDAGAEADTDAAAPACEAPVRTRVKADMGCLSVAAASVLAKVARDRIMVGLHEEYPAFGWNENKGYATSFHRDALRLAGPTPYHRTSWNLL
jgi:ribonuclease HII